MPDRLDRRDAERAADKRIAREIEAAALRVRRVLRHPRNRLVVETLLLEYVLSVLSDPDDVVPVLALWGPTVHQKVAILVGLMNHAAIEDADPEVRVDPFDALPPVWPNLSDDRRCAAGEGDLGARTLIQELEQVAAADAQCGDLLDKVDGLVQAAQEHLLAHRGPGGSSASLKDLLAKLEQDPPAALSAAETAALQALLRLPSPPRYDLRVLRNIQRRAMAKRDAARGARGREEAEGEISAARQDRRERMQPLLAWRRIRQLAAHALLARERRRAGAADAEGGLGGATVAPDEPDDTGYVANPSDLANYRLATRIAEAHSGDDHISLEKLRRTCTDYRTNGVRWTRPRSKKGRANPKRLLVHLGDWIAFRERLQCDHGDGFPAIPDAELSRRKEAIRAKKEATGK